MEQRLGPIVLLCLLVSAIFKINNTDALETRVDPQPTKFKAGQTQNSTAKALLQKLPLASGECGTSNDLAKRVEVCAKPLMDLLQGTVEKWPRTDEDAKKLCESFFNAERCIKDSSRKCGKGVHRTIVSTLALSIARARRGECSPSKYPTIVKTTICLERNQELVHDWMSNVTSRLSAIELQTREGDKKINAVCCMVNDIETEIKKILNPLCPTEGQLVNRLYRAVIEDVVELVCRNPKCIGYLKGYKISESHNFDGLISILLRIVFSLNSN